MAPSDHLNNFAGGDERHKREYQQSSSLLLNLLNVLSPWPGYLAGLFSRLQETLDFIFHHSGFVSEEIFQVQETDRID